MGRSCSVDCTFRVAAKATFRLDGETVAKGMYVIHMENTSLLKYNDENSLTCSVRMVYYSAKNYYMLPVREPPAGKEFADVVRFSRRDEKKRHCLLNLNGINRPNQQSDG